MNNEQRLINILLKSPIFKTVFDCWGQVGLSDCYVGGGSVTQIVWNHLSGRPFDYGLNDLDFVYFEKDITDSQESYNKGKVLNLFMDLNIEIDVTNEALDTWLPAFAIGVKKVYDQFVVYAPFGFDDLFLRIVRPNKKQITQRIYKDMVSRLKKDWSEIEVVDWD